MRRLGQRPGVDGPDLFRGLIRTTHYEQDSVRAGFAVSRDLGMLGRFL
jgi:hypothetical protein